MEYKPGSGRRLSDEHIVPEGLGGTLILPEASCADCAKITGNIEGSILRTLLWAPRRQLGVRSKKRKRAANRGFPITTVVGGKDVVFELPIEDHPSILLLLGLKTPRMLSFRAIGEPDVAGIWTHTFGSPTALYKRGAERIASPGFDTVRFCQMLAKIAHCFAVAELGAGGFIPVLPTFILRHFQKAEQYPDCFKYVGGDPIDYAPSADLHTLGYETISLGSKKYLVVNVRLFGNLGAPVYRVVAGEVLA
jgi:hypothetical protein